jgi:NAD(P)-dependent dehydrogenase (short-subunit alcohol dehydrogenase family)
MKKLQNRVALITGAASGIGKAIALKFASEGANIAIVDINKQSSEKLASEIEAQGRKVIYVECDVTNETHVNNAVESTVNQLGALHILVNNAGVSPLKPLDEIGLVEWNQVLAINLTGPFLFIKATFPHIIKAGNLGRVINMGSLAGQIGGIAVGLHYTASKGGIMSVSKQLAKLLAPYKATVNSIAPGTTDTPLVQAWPEETRQALIKQIPLGRLGLPEDVANVALFFASDEAQFITGTTINVNGGMYIA